MPLSTIMEPGISDSVTSLRHWAAETPARTLFTYLNNHLHESTTLDSATLDRRARALAAMLRDRSEPGERALLAYPTGADFVIALFACFYAGIVAVPAPAPRMANLDSPTLDRLARVADDCAPSLLLTTTALAEALASVTQCALCFATDTIPETLASGWSPHVCRDDAPALLQYTSGSTGNPKGVIVSHGNLKANLRIIHRTVQHDRNHCVVSWLPHYHDMGLIGNTIYPVVAGSTCCVMAPATFLQRPINWLRAISFYRAATSGAPNFAFDHCVRRTTPEERKSLDLSCWQVAFNGSEPVRAATLDRFVEAFAPHGFRRTSFLPCYGLAEATLLVTGGPRGRGPLCRPADPVALAAGKLQDAQQAAAPLVSSGQPQTDHEIIITDPATGNALPAGHIGEICVIGPSVTAGYWGCPDNATNVATAPADRGTMHPFLRTGDIGALWNEELYVTGRLKDLIIVDGRNHHAEDIEFTVE